VARASYALAMGVLLVVGGRLGDRFGKRRVFLIGMTGFTAASAMCGLSVDPAMIIVGRLIQGGFGALMIPQGISILMTSFSRPQFPRAVSAFGPAMGSRPSSDRSRRVSSSRPTSAGSIGARSS